MGILKNFNFNLQTDEISLEETANLKFIKNFLVSSKFQIEDLPKLISFLDSLEADKIFKKENLHKIESLTCKEKEILKLVISGNTSKQISKLLFIQETTVSTHRKNIREKLETKSLLDWNRFYNVYKNTYF
jgi:DNA-binding CsgD family transcriptional regulator